MTRTPSPRFIHEKPPEKQECPHCGGCFGLHFRWRCEWAQFIEDWRWDLANARLLLVALLLWLALHHTTFSFRNQ